MPSSRLLLLLALSLPLAACKDEPPPTDGTKLPEAEPGDWQDTGPFAECRIRSGTCGTRATFDTASCSLSTLASFQPEGIYTLQARYATNSGAILRPMSWRLSQTEEAEWLGSLRVTARELAPATVFYSGQRVLDDGTVFVRSFLGCRMPGTDQLMGCFEECRNGQRSARGSFQARRVTPIAGEPESSGLALVSETRVEQGTPVDVYVTKGHAYVVSLRSGLHVYDVRDPAHPVLTAKLSLPDDSYWNGVWSREDALYVASAGRGVLVYDISAPDAPVFVKNVPETPTNVHTVFVSENLLFGAAQEPDGAVLVFDVTAPLSPVLLSKFQARNFKIPQEGDGPHDMLAFEGRLYVNFWGAGYVVASLDDPASPTELGRYRYQHATSHANAVGRFGNRLIAFEGGEDWGAHLRVLDVTDPARIQLIGEWRLREHISIHNMVLVGTRLYIAHYQDGVRVLDVSVPETPRQVAHVRTFRAEAPNMGRSFYDGAIGIRVPGDGYVYAVDNSRGLLILREE
jgi:hypothetical protein